MGWGLDDFVFNRSRFWPFFLLVEVDAFDRYGKGVHIRGDHAPMGFLMRRLLDIIQSLKKPRKKND